MKGWLLKGDTSSPPFRVGPQAFSSFQPPTRLNPSQRRGCAQSLHPDSTPAVCLNCAQPSQPHLHRETQAPRHHQECAVHCRAGGCLGRVPQNWWGQGWSSQASSLASKSHEKKTSKLLGLEWALNWGQAPYKKKGREREVAQCFLPGLAINACSPGSSSQEICF